MTPTALNGPSRRAFTLVEAIMASLVVALILAGALHAVGASGGDQVRAAHRVSAGFLGQSLLDEACAKKYNAAAGGGGLSVLIVGLVGGLEEIGGELGGGQVIDSGSDRTHLTSVDDYNGLIDSPPHDPDGSKIAGFGGWSREVKVQTVSSTDGWTLSGSDVGAKRVTVTVKKGSAVVESRSALVVNAP